MKHIKPSKIFAQVVLGVYTGDGAEVCGGVAADSGSGPPHPTVYYHNNNPVWEETFRIQVGQEYIYSNVRIPL